MCFRPKDERKGFCPAAKVIVDGNQKGSQGIVETRGDGFSLFDLTKIPGTILHPLVIPFFVPRVWVITGIVNMGA